MSESASCCPYLKRAGSEVHYSIQGYCQRPPVCELRVPSLAEFQGFCTTTDYRHCSIYRFGMEAANYQCPLPTRK